MSSETLALRILQKSQCDGGLRTNWAVLEKAVKPRRAAQNDFLQIEIGTNASIRFSANSGSLWIKAVRIWKRVYFLRSH